MNTCCRALSLSENKMVLEWIDIKESTDLIVTEEIASQSYECTWNI